MPNYKPGASMAAGSGSILRPGAALVGPMTGIGPFLGGASGGGAPALWTPLALGSALVEWWDASDTAHIALSGSNVTSWTGKVGGIAASQATGANQPTWSATALNGKPGLTFNGTSQLLTFSPTALPLGSAASSVAIAASYTASANNSIALSWGTATANSLRAYGKGTGNLGLFSTATANQNTAETFGGNDVVSIFNTPAGASPTNAIFVNGGVNENLAYATLSTTSASGAIGSWPSGSFLMQGIIQQVIICNRVLTADELYKLAGFLSWYCGQAGANLPYWHPYKNAAPTVTPLTAVQLIPGLFNFNPAFLTNLHAAKASVVAGSSNANVLFIGDSTTAGFGGTPSQANAIANSYPMQLAPLLSVNASSSSTFGNHNADAVATNLQIFDSRVSQGGFTTPNQFTLGGPGYGTNASGSPFTFTPLNNVDTFNYYYQESSTGGGATIAINGGSTTAINQTNASNAVGNTIKVGTLGSNTVDIAWASAGNATYIAVIAYNSAAKELSLLNAGSSSAVAANFADATNPWSPLNFQPVLNPKLTFIDLTINDANAGTNTATYQAQIQSIITAAKLTGDVVLMTGVPGTVSSDATQATYCSIVQSLAVSNNCVLIDMRSAWFTWNLGNNNGWMFNNLHPNAAGYAVQAGYISTLLNAA